MDIDELKNYITELDSADKTIINNDVAEKGIIKYLSQQLIYLDCSRVYKDGSRAMQTIGYPYQRCISSYLYALEIIQDDLDYINLWKDKLMERHKANLEYEKENPPIWYGGKKAKAKWDKEHNKLPRRRNVKEQTIPGMGKEISNAERLKRLSAQFGKLNFKIKPTKKDD
mgnify:CR=1 FL=1